MRGMVGHVGPGPVIRHVFEMALSYCQQIESIFKRWASYFPISRQLHKVFARSRVSARFIASVLGL